MGILFDIQQLCVHDGPGIRTTVFLKGCPLRCIWCHNPESLIKTKQLHYIDDLCIQCQKCSKVCTNGVHHFNEGNHEVNFSQCISCGQCNSLCPSLALSMRGETVDSQTILDIVAKDEVFFGKEGGVTFSGGEAMLQIDFLLELLIGAKKRGYHTCVDTSGYASWDNFLKIIPYTDCFLYDIKAYSSETHQKATGVDNSLIKENLSKLSDLHQRIFIRIPLIQEYNANITEVTAMARWLSTKKIEGVTLMPYHLLGKSKRTMLGMDQGPSLSPPSDEDMLSYKHIFANYNINLI